VTGKAWNSTPTHSGGQTNRLSKSGKEPERGVRCTYVVDGHVCDAFPSWEVPGTNGRERRCARHQGKE
jgi:hypothetical protein